MTLLIATASLAAILAQTSGGSAVGPARGSAVPVKPSAAVPAQPQLFATPPRRGVTFHPSPATFAQPVTQPGDRIACGMRIVSGPPDPDPGIAIPASTDRDYKIRRIVPKCLE